MNEQTVITTSPESLTFLISVYSLSIFIHILALIIHATWVIPLQIKEANVKNGLRRLRVLMLASGITFIFLSIVTIFVLTSRFFIPASDLYRYISVSMVLLHAIGFLTFSLIKRAIYKQQYSTEQKSLHAKLDKIEHANASKQ